MTSALDRGEEKLKFVAEELQPAHYEDDISGYCSLNSEKAESPVTPNISRNSTIVATIPSMVSAGGNTPPSLDEKRMRREIANSNERRRMQSINAGFQSLRSLLPHHEGEKLSKAAILQQTAEYIYQLEQERTQLLSQNCQLKRTISQHEGELALNNSPPSPSTASKKRKTTDSSDEDITDSDEFVEMKMELDRERALRIHLEEKIQRLESMYPISPSVTSTEKIQESLSPSQITIQYHEDQVIKEETLDSGNNFDNRRELLCNGGGAPSQTVCTESKRSGTTSVILQPVTHEESLLPTTIISGHQYSVTPTLVNQPSSCSPTTSIKIKPKVEVERLPSPTSVALITTIAATRLTTTTTNSSSLICNTSSTAEQTMPSASAKVYLTSTSRQNLETIVEAIRHLEGDSLFDSASGGATSPNTCSSNQEVPLALTKRNSQALLQVDMNPFLRFHSRQNTQTGSTNAVNTTTEQQQRPGVIVVKQQT